MLTADSQVGAINEQEKAQFDQLYTLLNRLGEELFLLFINFNESLPLSDGTTLDIKSINSGFSLFFTHKNEKAQASSADKAASRYFLALDNILFNKVRDSDITNNLYAWRTVDCNLIAPGSQDADSYWKNPTEAHVFPSPDVAASGQRRSEFVEHMKAMVTRLNYVVALLEKSKFAESDPKTKEFITHFKNEIAQFAEKN